MGITNEYWDRIREEAKGVQHDDHEYLEGELWQSVRELFENAEANTNDELGVVDVLEDEGKYVTNRLENVFFIAIIRRGFLNRGAMQ